MATLHFNSDTSIFHKSITPPEIQESLKEISIINPEKAEILGEYIAKVENEYREILWRLKKQEYDFRTIFECVKQVSARSLEVNQMLKFVMRTMMGQFGIYKVLVLRTVRESDEKVNVLKSIGKIGIKEKVPEDVPYTPILNRMFSHQGVFKLEDIDLTNFPWQLREISNMGFEHCVPLLNEDRTAEDNIEGLIFLGPRLSGDSLNSEDIEFLILLANVVAISFRNESLYRRAIIDDLTQVHSRGRLDAQLIQEINRVDRYDLKGIGFLMLDVDHFKEFNDKYGHQTGDIVLKKLAELLKKQVRVVDVVARYGGEEFAIILLEIDKPKSVEVAERIRKAVNNMRIRSLDNELLSIHVSIGVACYPEDASDKQELVKKADMALYRAKEKGRNRVEVA